MAVQNTEQPDRRVEKAFLLFLASFFAGCCLLLGASFFLGKSRQLITSDGNAYYSWLPSVLIDHDLDFSNNFRDLYPPGGGPKQPARTPKGLIINKCPVGMAIIEIPGFLTGHAVARLGSFIPNGASSPYQIAVTMWLLILYVCSFYLLFLALRAHGVRDTVAFFFATMALLGTNLIHYVAKEPAMPHAANVALINLLLIAAVSGRKSVAHDLLSGVVLGLLLITRNATIVFVPWIMFLFFRHDPAPRRFAFFLSGLILMGLIHLQSFYLLWGRPILMTYGDEGFTGGLRGMAGSLFGTQHGLFVYHPWYAVLLILNVVGWWRLREQRTVVTLVLTGFLLLWAFNGNWWCWWFGAGFGNRAFIESLIPLTFGAALLAEHEFDRSAPSARRCLLLVAVILVVLNLCLWAGYLLQAYSPSGRHTIVQAYFWFWR